MMGREEAVDRRNLCNRKPIRPRKKMIRHRQEEYSAYTSISSVILKAARMRWRRLSLQTSRNSPESGSPSNSKATEQRLLMESPRRRRIVGSARVPFLGTLTEEEWEVHHRDHENRKGCRMDRLAFMEEVWTVVQSYGTRSILKLGLNRPLMREVLDRLDECEGRLSELLLDSATDESEANSPSKMTPQEDKGEVLYLSRTRKGTMRSKLVIDKNNETKMKLGSKVTLRKAGRRRWIRKSR